MVSMSKKTLIKTKKMSDSTQTYKPHNDISNSNIEKTTRTWKLVLTACSLIGAGFVAGIYIGYNSSKIESQDKINEYRERIIEMGQEHEKDVHDYNREISRLTDENNDLKNQIRQLKSKKK